MTATITEFQMADNAISPIQMAWAAFRRALADNPALGALVRILNGVELRAREQLLVEVTERDLADALRLKRLAERTLNSLHGDIVDAAVEDAAHVCAEGAEGEYERFGNLRPSMQDHYRRLAVSVTNAYNTKLERQS